MRKTIFHLLQKGSDTYRGSTCEDKHELRNLGRTGRETRKLQWKRPCICQLSAQTRRPPQDRSEFDRSGQVHVSHMLVGDGREDLDPVTPQSQGLCTEIKLNKLQCSSTVILIVKLCPLALGSNEIWTSNVNSKAIALSSDTKLEQAIEDDPRKELELSVLHCSLEMEIRVSNADDHFKEIELPRRTGGTWARFEIVGCTTTWFSFENWL